MMESLLQHDSAFILCHWIMVKMMFME